MMVLVTGASGFIGRRLVTALSARGDRVRALVRRESRTQDILIPGVEVFRCDLGRDDPTAALDGVDVVCHLAAATRGSWPEHARSTVEGTRVLVEAARGAKGLSRFVHVSTMSVYDPRTMRRTTEDSALEPRPDLRGAYTRAKLEAEYLVAAHAIELNAIILRPGIVFGAGGQRAYGDIGFRVGRLLLSVGPSTRHLPMVHAEDLVRALLKIADGGGKIGQIYNVAAPALTVADYLAQLRRESPELRTLPFPRWVVYGAAGLLELFFGSKAPINKRKAMAAFGDRDVDSSRAAEEIGWIPTISLAAGWDL